MHGFSLNYVGPRTASEAKNLKSAVELSEITQQKIDMEVVAVQVAGSFPCPPLPNLRISPLVEKKKKSYHFRLIHNLLYPLNL